MKLLVEEDGSPDMHRAAGSAEALVSAAIAYVELRAALAAAIRERRLPSALREQTMLALERLWAGVAEVSLDALLLRQAGELAERMRLRGYDAVHLAALIESGGPPEVTFACWDVNLRNAAGDLGYTLVPQS